MYKDMMDTIGMVNAADPELGAAMERELTRQRENIELIASENIVSPAVMVSTTLIRINSKADQPPEASLSSPIPAHRPTLPCILPCWSWAIPLWAWTFRRAVT